METHTPQTVARVGADWVHGPLRGCNGLASPRVSQHRAPSLMVQPLTLHMISWTSLKTTPPPLANHQHEVGAAALA